MILLGLAVVTVLLVAVWRRIEHWGYLKMGEQYERELAQRREWRVGVPEDPNKPGRRRS